jgi:diguanylate cyclase (GGDEF)-like protein
LARYRFRKADVLLYLLTVAVANLALGYGLGMYLRRKRSKAAAAPLPAMSAGEEAAAVAATVQTAPLLPLDPSGTASLPGSPPLQAAAVATIASGRKPAQVAQELSAQWQQALREAAEGASFLEASIQIMRLEVGRYRERLVNVDGLLRKCLRNPKLEPLIVCVGELQEANDGWLRTQAEGIAALQAGGSQFSDMAAQGGGLAEILHEQTAQIEATCSDLERLDLRSDVGEASGRIIAEVCKLLDIAHRLRDRMLESMVNVLHQEQRLLALDPNRLVDAAAGVHNRLGLERMLAGWWDADPVRSRQASFALVDIDRLGRINEEHGPVVGDSAISHIGRRIGENLRRNRGFDVAGRLAGQTFAMFLADTAPQDVVLVVERIRQGVMANQFLFEGQDVELSVTCAIVEVGADDTSASLRQRAMQLLRGAKRAGRNLTLLQGPGGATVVEPPNCQVTSAIVRLDQDLPALV